MRICLCTSFCWRKLAGACGCGDHSNLTISFIAEHSQFELLVADVCTVSKYQCDVTLVSKFMWLTEMT